MGVSNENDATSLSPSNSSQNLECALQDKELYKSSAVDAYSEDEDTSLLGSGCEPDSKCATTPCVVVPEGAAPLKETSLSTDCATPVDCDVASSKDDVIINDDEPAQACEESELLQRSPESIDTTQQQSVGEVPVVISVDPVEERSWLRIAERARCLNNPREAVRALGKPKYPEHTIESSPFSYKNWLLQLTRRRRLEIFIAVGLSLWLAFFIVLAIFMNGQSIPPADNHSSSGSKGSSAGPSWSRPDEDPVFPSNASVDNKFPIRGRNGSNPGLVTSTTFTPDKQQPHSTKASTTASASRVHPAVATVADGAAQTNAAPPNASADVVTSFAEGEPLLSTTAPGMGDGAESTSAEQAGSPKFQEKVNSLADADELLLEMLKDEKADYRIGVGRADITGPAADANMMGYANPNQVAGGIHFRQYSRAFVVAQPGKKRFVFVNIDACMGSMLLKLEVIKRLKAVFGELYNAENLCISGTHTHSAPAGFLQDVLFQITSMGYIPETLTAMVDGIVESIRIAHDRLAPGHIVMSKGELLGSSINRSPSAYINNPPEERKRYSYNVDKQMTLLKFLDENGKGIGMINWFAVHCTSMNNTNSLISGDNKGYAELLFEEVMDPGSLPGHSDFVAAFAQSNEGDVSPNIRGPHCIDTGEPCDHVHSTCNGKVQNCIASGPGKDMFESTEIIGRNQFNKAMELYKEARDLLKGPVQVVHQYIDMTNQTVRLNSTHTAQTCKPAMGFSFAAGTTDGPGAFDFRQGDKTGNKFWTVVRNFLHTPSQAQKECHAPKPILVDTGEMNSPYEWQPEVVDTQLIRIGQLVIAALPGEFTTMSGRRIKDAVLETYAELYPHEKFEAVIAGLSNTYSDYIATFEEYHVQRYEGASTIYGPHTLQAYVQQYKKLARAASKGTPLNHETEAKDIKSDLMSFLPGVIYDSTSWGYSRGDVLVQPKDSYKVGETVAVEFVAANPRNSPSANMTFLTVERQLENGQWKVVHNDASWDTKFIWKRTSTIMALSEATVEWHIASGTPSGLYRVLHHGHYKALWSRRVYPYTGKSNAFRVTEGAT